MTAEETLTRVITEKKAEAIGYIREIAERRIEEISTWADDYLTGLKALNALDLKTVLDNGGAVRTTTVVKRSSSTNMQGMMPMGPHLQIDFHSVRTAVSFPELGATKAIRFTIIAEPVELPPDSTTEYR